MSSPFLIPSSSETQGEAFWNFSYLTEDTSFKGKTLSETSFSPLERRD
jgi:hypothetical protein